MLSNFPDTVMILKQIAKVKSNQPPPLYRGLALLLILALLVLSAACSDGQAASSSPDEQGANQKPGSLPTPTDNSIARPSPRTTIASVPTSSVAAVSPTAPTAPTATRTSVAGIIGGGNGSFTPNPTESRGDPTSGIQPGQSRPAPGSYQISYLQAGDVWVSDQKGGNQRQITRNGGLQARDLSWSPTFDRLAVIEQGALFVYDLNGNRVSYFRAEQGAQKLNNIGWSPDGRYLAFDLIQAPLIPKPANTPVTLATDGEIWLIDFNSATPSAGGINTVQRPSLPTRLASGYNFAWSPDGRYLAYASPARRLVSIQFGGSSSSIVTPTASITTSVPPATRTPIPTRTPITVVGGIVVPSRAAPSPSPSLSTTTTITKATTLQVPFENSLMVFELASRQELELAQSYRLPGYPSTDGSVLPVEGTAIQSLWWTTDSQQVIFADQVSFVGSVAATGGTPRMLFGQKHAFALSKLFWLPGGGDTPLLIWNTLPGDERSLMGVLSKPGVVNSVVSDRLSCPAIAPNQSLLAYADNASTQLARLDGTTLSTIKGGGCPVWSPDGSRLITALANGDGSLLIFNPTTNVSQAVLGPRAVDKVLWYRPTQ